MKFKSTENELIWESHYNAGYHEQFSDEDEDFMDDGEGEIVISSEPIGDVDIEEYDDDDDFDDDGDSDDENEIVLHTIRKLIKRGKTLSDLCRNGHLKPWMIAKIIKAEDYITDVWDQLDDTGESEGSKFGDPHHVSL